MAVAVLVAVVALLLLLGLESGGFGSKDGHHYKNASSTNIATSACRSGSGSGIAGTLRMVGGQGLDQPVPGTISIVSASGSRCDTSTLDGAFSVALSVGSYTVTGRSPRFQDGNYECFAGGDVAVTKVRRVKATVVCAVR